MAQETHEVVVQVPDLGLDDKQLHALKETFHNQIVTSMGGKSALSTRIIIVVIRVQRQL
jgi:hypothetical protein